MTNMVFDTYNDMAEYMICCDEHGSLADALMPVDEATELIRSLLMNDVDIACMDIARGEIDGYDEEYLVSVVDSMLYVERAYNVERKEYVRTDADILLVCDDCGYDHDDCGMYAHYLVTNKCGCDECDCEDSECCCEECDDEECEVHNGMTYRVIDDDGNVIGTAKISVEVEIDE